MRTLLVLLTGVAAWAQNAPDHPSVIAQGKTFTPASILARNMGSPEDQTTAFPPHKIVGNVYYVGTPNSELVPHRNPRGNILIDSTGQNATSAPSRNRLNNSASILRYQDPAGQPHGDHMEGDAGEGATGAQVVSMAEDVPALKAIKPGGKSTHGGSDYS